MVYDLIAAFYENANDSTPRFRVPLSSIHVDSFDFFPENGFREDSECDGYVDYSKEVTVDELQKWTDDEYDPSEILDVIYSGLDFEKIEIKAYELDVIEGKIPHRGFETKDASIWFTGNSPKNDVAFLKNIHDDNGKIHVQELFFVPLHVLKDYYDVLTMLEVRNKMMADIEENKLTFTLLKEKFEQE